MAMGAPFEAVSYFSTLFLFQAAALGVLLAGGTKGAACLYVNLKILGPVTGALGLMGAGQKVGSHLNLAHCLDMSVCGVGMNRGHR